MALRYTGRLIFKTMYQRFLNNNDYLGLITEEALSQLTRGNQDRFAMAEEAAESSVLEYLTEHYDIEKVLEEGKEIIDYNSQITYPANSHFYSDGVIYKTLRVISGRVRPYSSPYWVEVCTDDPDVDLFDQNQDYYAGDIVAFANTTYLCNRICGPSFNDIRIPGMNGWLVKESPAWIANNPYPQWQVVSYQNAFYTLTENPSGVDWTKNPYESDQWGMIADYDPNYNEYEFSDHEYVVFENKVFYPTMSVNSPVLKENYNIIKSDPRNGNIKKHMLRLALYELHKLISPNNVSQTRITDYETSIVWLRDVARFKLNPQIPRKSDENDKPVTDYAMATFARDYDPNNNPWQV